MYSVGIITASDKGYVGHREDISGKVIEKIIKDNGFELSKYIVLPDDREMLAAEMVLMSDELKIDLILTTGGTGFAQRDVTPEATKDIIERDVPGIPEAIRAYSLHLTKRAMLSRAVAGIRKGSLIVNLPGSPKAVDECLSYIIDELTHGLDILTQGGQECAR